MKVFLLGSRREWQIGNALSIINGPDRMERFGRKRKRKEGRREPILQLDLDEKQTQRWASSPSYPAIQRSLGPKPVRLKNSACMARLGWIYFSLDTISCWVIELGLDKWRSHPSLTQLAVLLIVVSPWYNCIEIRVHKIVLLLYFWLTISTFVCFRWKY